MQVRTRLPKAARIRRPTERVYSIDTVRIGPVAALPAVLTDLGVEPRRVFSRARVSLSAFRDPDAVISFERLGLLFQYAEEFSGCHRIGLLVGERFRLESLGVLGHLMRNSRTVGDGLRVLLLHLHLYDRGAVPVLLNPEPASAILGYSIYRHQTPGTRQMYGAAVTIGFRILQALCGPRWRPVDVLFSFARPADPRAYRRVFGVTPRFDSDVSGIALKSSQLAQPIPGADPVLRDVLAESLERAAPNGPVTFAQRVRGVLHQAILGGNASTRGVAGLFGINERSLRKRLTADGSRFQELLNETRSELAQHLLENTRMPISEIAAALHYADHAVFSRAFRSWLGLSPSQFRRASPLALRMASNNMEVRFRVI